MTDEEKQTLVSVVTNSVQVALSGLDQITSRKDLIDKLDQSGAILQNVEVAYERLEAIQTALVEGLDEPAQPTKPVTEKIPAPPVPASAGPAPVTLDNKTKGSI